MKLETPDGLKIKLMITKIVITINIFFQFLIIQFNGLNLKLLFSVLLLESEFLRSFIKLIQFYTYIKRDNLCLCMFKFKNKLSKMILLSILCLLIGQALVWFQGYGSTKIQWLSENKWLLYISSIPITWLFITGIELGVKGLDGEMWAIRLITFACGIVVFAILTYFIMGESITPKTIVSVLLALSIVFLQLFWK